jgi:transcriptional regulator with XRE-family HTH domain
MEKSERFAGCLKELRMQAGLTQQQLAEKAGVGQRTISHLEQGVQEPVWSTLLALADALGVDCTAFLEEPAAEPPAGPGRPRKPAAESADQQPKRPRGRPRKAPAVAQMGQATEGQAGKQSGEEKPGKGKGHKREGKKE